MVRDYLKKNHLDDKVVLKGARCTNRCSEGPHLKINGRAFAQIGLQNIEKLLEKELSQTGR